MFRSKLGALAFLGMILLAVYRMVGTEENAGDIALAGERIAEQREALESQDSAASPVAVWEEDEATDEAADDDWGDEAAAPGEVL